MKINYLSRKEVILFSNVSLFINIFCRFPGIFIENMTFEEFVQFCMEFILLHSIHDSLQLYVFSLSNY